MPQLKLTYFDTHGGRGEPARLAMRIGNIPFEDDRFPFAEFAEVRKSTPFGQVPTLHVDGQQVTQSDAITRYVGKLAGLYPTDAYQALLCDEVIDALEDVNVKLGQTFGLQADALKLAREALVQGPLTLYLCWLQTQLRARGGQYFADQRLTIADLKVFVLVRWLNSGRLDHVPTDLVARVAPDLLAHLERVAATPAIQQYYASVQA
ncbi:glutathione S-transferase [Paucibacter sp. KCTC 42545]|uniref:glutathione S-transferase n=1 Tax=Paucibacter sp. KCTC 42545 TaxID=1768242 RepID=UPI000733C3B3|nr:glutathione S-transferase family protein [Paucibacter sp. KCTC 42545]ALT79659.1 glutathione S-transferase [Paucibacter sp. KCTC 42545]